MKRKLFSFMIFIGLFALIVAGCSDTNASGEKGEGEVYEINVSNFQPSTHHYVKNVFEPWKELVEEKTDGQVQVNLYHGGTLGKSNSVYEDVSGGIADVGVVISTYYYDSDFFPYTIGNLPFAFPDSIVGSKIMTEFGEKYGQNAFEDVHYLGGAYVTDPYNLFSTKPIQTVEDFKGLKMRVQGKADVPLVEAWGAVPVSIPLDETYEALQKGTMDTAFYSTIGVLGHKYYEVAPYMVDMGTTVTPVTPVMNKNSYESLPEDLQIMFDEEFGPKLSELLSETHHSELDLAKEELEQLIDGKGEIIKLDATVEEELKSSAEDIWNEWVVEADKKGYPGEEMMDYFKELITKEGLDLPF